MTSKVTGCLRECRMQKCLNVNEVHFEQIDLVNNFKNKCNKIKVKQSRFEIFDVIFEQKESVQSKELYRKIKFYLNSALFIKFPCSTTYYTLHGPFEKKNKYYRPCSQNRESKKSVNDLAGFAVGVAGQAQEQSMLQKNLLFKKYYRRTELKFNLIDSLWTNLPPPSSHSLPS